MHRAGRNQRLFVARWSVVNVLETDFLVTSLGMYVVKNDMRSERVAISLKSEHVSWTCRRWRHTRSTCRQSKFSPR